MNEPATHRGGCCCCDRILDAAARLFGERGPDAVSTAEIAREAEVNKALIFYHFKSKQGLYVAVFGRWLHEFADRVEPAIADAAPGIGRIEVFVRNHIAFIGAHRDMARAMIRELLGPEPARSAVMIQASPVLTRLRTALLSAFVEARAAGDIRDMDPLQAMVSIISLDLFYFLGQPLVTLINPGADLAAFERDRVNHVIDLILNGLRKQPE